MKMYISVLWWLQCGHVNLVNDTDFHYLKVQGSQFRNFNCKITEVCDNRCQHVNKKFYTNLYHYSVGTSEPAHNKTTKGMYI